MNLIPMPKTVQRHDGLCDFDRVYLATDTLPAFLHAEYTALTADNTQRDIPLTVSMGEDEMDEGYTLTVAAEAVRVESKGYKGAFYALQTLKQLLDGGRRLACVTVEDEPDLRYRGFYQDVSRGRIPTLATLKRLVDRLSALKMNSLQLYVEHTHRFAEYAGIQEELGFYTDEEIRELDVYCRERGVELIPSLSSFGHLYFLLQSPSYHHLCELESYKPTRHCWHERLMHHTIDPLNPESVKLITSIMAQYIPLFSSQYFNICCDETFDLCKGRNTCGDVATLYADFVGKLIAFLREHGKTAMMWGDIVLRHPDVLGKLPDDVVYLNWCYDTNGSGLHPETLAGHPQIVCPSVHSHKRFVEKIVYSAPNIANVLEQGFEHGAVGMLNTNWGDYGHVCDDEGMLYGMAFGAAKAWNIQGTDLETFDRSASRLIYRSDSTDVIDILKTLNACDEIWFPREGYEMALWELTVQLLDDDLSEPVDRDYRFSVLREAPLAQKRSDALACAARLRDMVHGGRLDAAIGRSLILAARAMAVVFRVLEARANGVTPDADTVCELESWLSDFENVWHERNQTGEWHHIATFFQKNMCR